MFPKTINKKLILVDLDSTLALHVVRFFSPLNRDVHQELRWNAAIRFTVRPDGVLSVESVPSRILILWTFQGCLTKACRKSVQQPIYAEYVRNRLNRWRHVPVNKIWLKISSKSASVALSFCLNPFRSVSFRSVRMEHRNIKTGVPTMKSKLPILTS